AAPTNCGAPGTAAVTDGPFSSPLPPLLSCWRCGSDCFCSSTPPSSSSWARFSSPVSSPAFLLPTSPGILVSATTLILPPPPSYAFDSGEETAPPAAVAASPPRPRPD
ncbi:unnamed protein product, partial [Ectocarpus sp. 6 AP-2014]